MGCRYPVRRLNLQSFWVSAKPGRALPLAVVVLS